MRSLCLVLLLASGCASVQRVPIYTNPHERLVTVYYEDGQMQHVMPGETAELLSGLAYKVQVKNPIQFAKRR